ncbi:rRNA maturation RNase YbeY [Spirochaeta isovalerica]|uniref:Endoribonuclease YbeY n=1 Tax=Spirochaeta isovalerica TaxID=150 RepID=A0A841R6Z6_9SPIO|nr:rRNA maturation RNase YbeY [Spirochaeta isovalerica]MBB6478538.1 putative rRNA maturation factor [Spirochaeta isovalerica]
MNSIDVLCENIAEPEWLDNVDRFLQALLENLKIENWEFSLTFCDNEFIQDLNRNYREKDSPTDVLTFVQDDDPFPLAGESDLHHAGDIIISLDTLAENAEYFHVEKEEELKRLIVHGVLHLSGMDHSDNSPEQEMLIFQEKLLGQLAEVKIF